MSEKKVAPERETACTEGSVNKAGRLCIDARDQVAAASKPKKAAWT